jgi:hypothetical protein
MTIRAWIAVVLDDFRALTRSILEHADSMPPLSANVRVVADGRRKRGSGRT